MNTQKIIEDVLELYVGSQINIDSEAARTQLATHISAEIDANKNWDTIHGDSEYKEFRVTDNDLDDLHI